MRNLMIKSLLKRWRRSSRGKQLMRWHNHIHTCFVGIVASLVFLNAFQPVLSAQIGEEDQDSLSLLSEEFLNSIEKANSTWKIKRNHFRALTGVHPDYKPNQLPLLSTSLTTPAGSIPDEFDAREQWPNCSSIREIPNQGHCEDCYVVSVVGAMSDRWCIHSDGENFHFSAQDLLSCCTECGNCQTGGWPNKAWKYWKTNGVVSGGIYGSKHEDKGCRPYTIKPNHHHSHDVPHTPKCIQKCVKGYDVAYEDDLRYGKTAYSLKKEPYHMQHEILNNGPINTIFTVYKDFHAYGEGVYQHVKGKRGGRHVVKIIGWGTEDEVPYWLAANSWGTEWGNLGGFFKIKRGSNECGIEEDITAGMPKLDKA